jgi:hypothetical protein
VTLEVLMARKSAIELVAVPGRVLSLSSSCIARMPKGVAALPSPSALADMFRIMAPIAGWSGGTSGKRRVISGRIRRAMTTSMPPASATFINPRKSVITPTRPMANSTAPLAAASISLDSTAIGVCAPSTTGRVSSRQAVARKPIRTMPKKIPFM